MKPLSPTEYEILFALFQLRTKGMVKVFFKDICKEVNKRRRLNGQKQLSIQLIHYYLKRLRKRPFLKRENSEHITKYSLKNGTWKLNQSPPLCIYIGNDAHFMLVCDKVATCKLPKPNIECIKRLVNMGKIQLLANS